MSKYIIELNEDCKIVQQMCVTEHGNAYTDGCYSCDLEEFNSDYINEHFGELQDEAYQRGHDDGYEAGCATAFKPVSDAEYQRGLEDAWVAVRKIVSMPDDPYWELFGDYKAEIIKNTTVSEVIAKLKAYEDKHSDRIEVGDIVDVYGNLGVVTYMDELKACVMMIEDGSSGNWNLSECKKTGKHYDIQSILEEMKS